MKTAGPRGDSLRMPWSVLLSLALGVSLPPPAAAWETPQTPTVLRDGPGQLDLGLGAFNVQAHGTSADAEAQLEYRDGHTFHGLGPVVGLVSETRGGVVGYGGVYADIAWRDVVATPLAAIAGYHRGGAPDLGQTLQFRLGLTVAYRLSDDSRIGVRFAHVSNAGYSHTNPGENELLVSYSVPLRDIVERWQ